MPGLKCDGFYCDKELDAHACSADAGCGLIGCPSAKPINGAEVQLVTVPSDVLMGLIRAAEFLEHDRTRTGDDGKLWDTQCRKALEYARSSGLRSDMLKLHGPPDFKPVHPELPY